MTASENITELKPNQVFVFGSNLAGKHAGGAAAQAHKDFGAELGVGEGKTGRCYAFPTLDKDFKRLPIFIRCHVRDTFFRCAVSHPDEEYLLTKVGCGIAGYPEEDMMLLFSEVPPNVIKPPGW